MGSPDDVELLVENLISQAGLAEADGDPVVRCDNTGVTTIEAPPTTPTSTLPVLAPQAAIRVSTDLSANVEAAPIVNYFAAAVGAASTRPAGVRDPHSAVRRWQPLLRHRLWQGQHHQRRCQGIRSR